MHIISCMYFTMTDYFDNHLVQLSFFDSVYFFYYTPSALERKNKMILICSVNMALPFILLSYLHLLLQDQKSYDYRPKESII